MQEEKILIEGMSCQHCVSSVRQALTGVEGLHVVDVHIGAATVLTDSTAVLAQARKAIEVAGFDVKST